MTAYYQLSLFPNEPPTPVEVLNKKRQPKPQLTVIESCCTTQRATELLDVSPTTLYRARKAGQSYQKRGWIAESIGDNAWRVVFSSGQV